MTKAVPNGRVSSSLGARQQKVAWVIDGPAPYRFPVYAELAKHCELNLLFVENEVASRGWKVPEDLSVSARLLETFRLNVLGKSLTLLKLSSLKSVDKYDAVVVNGWHLIPFLQIIMRVPKKKLVIFYESTLRSRRKHNGPISWVRKLALGKANVIVTPGKAATSAVRDILGSSAEVIESFNSIDVNHFTPSSPRVKRTGHKFLYVGRFIPLKRVPWIISAFEKIADAHDVLTLAGYGPMESEIVQLAQNSELHGQIKFVGKVDYKDLPNLYQDHDSLVLASDQEVWGLVVNEALCMGLGAVVSKVAGCWESVSQFGGVHGFAVESQESLVQAMRNAKQRASNTIDTSGIRALSSPMKLAGDVFSAISKCE